MDLLLAWNKASPHRIAQSTDRSKAFGCDHIETMGQREAGIEEGGSMTAPATESKTLTF